MFRQVLFLCSEDWVVLHWPEPDGVLPTSLILSMTKLEFRMQKLLLIQDLALWFNSANLLLSVYCVTGLENT